MHLAELFSTLCLTGLIWTIQAVHYPLLSRVGRDAFVGYHGEHTVRITRIVAPLMFVELLTSGHRLLVAGTPSRWEAAVGFALTCVVWASTALVQVPLHQRLAAGLDEALVARLVRGNWVRTVAWSARAILLLWWTARTRH